MVYTRLAHAHTAYLIMSNYALRPSLLGVRQIEQIQSVFLSFCQFLTQPFTPLDTSLILLPEVRYATWQTMSSLDSDSLTFIDICTTIKHINSQPSKSTDAKCMNSENSELIHPQ